MVILHFSIEYAIQKQNVKKFFEKVENLSRYGVQLISDDLTLFPVTQTAPADNCLNIF